MKNTQNVFSVLVWYGCSFCKIGDFFPRICFEQR